MLWDIKMKCNSLGIPCPARGRLGWAAGLASGAAAVREDDEASLGIMAAGICGDVREREDQLKNPLWHIGASIDGGFGCVLWAAGVAEGWHRSRASSRVFKGWGSIAGDVEMKLAPCRSNCEAMWDPPRGNFGVLYSFLGIWWASLGCPSAGTQQQCPAPGREAPGHPSLDAWCSSGEVALPSVWPQLSGWPTGQVWKQRLRLVVIAETFCSPPWRWHRSFLPAAAPGADSPYRPVLSVVPSLPCGWPWAPASLQWWGRWLGVRAEPFQP